MFFTTAILFLNLQVILEIDILQHTKNLGKLKCTLSTFHTARKKQIDANLHRKVYVKVVEKLLGEANVIHNKYGNFQLIKKMIKYRLKLGQVVIHPLKPKPERLLKEINSTNKKACVTKKKLLFTSINEDADFHQIQTKAADHIYPIKRQCCSHIGQWFLYEGNTCI